METRWPGSHYIEDRGGQDPALDDQDERFQYLFDPGSRVWLFGKYLLIQDCMRKIQTSKSVT